MKALVLRESISRVMETILETMMMDERENDEKNMMGCRELGMGGHISPYPGLTLCLPLLRDVL